MAERFKWQEAHARLEETQQGLQAAGQLRPEEVARILRDRARALAKPVEVAPTFTEVLDLLVFSVAGGRYAIETVHVLEVIPLRELTPVPCTPSFVLGVVNHRGRILPVLDFGRLFDLTGAGVTEGSRVVAVEAGGTMFGIFTDSVAGTIQVSAHEIGHPPVTLTGGRHAFLRGVTGAMVALLDLEALAKDPRIAVNEE